MLWDLYKNEQQQSTHLHFRFTLDNLKWAITVCDVDKKSKIKDDYIDNLLGWCLDPRPSGKVRLVLTALNCFL